MTRLSVNVDHVATLRQARGTDYPEPVHAARLAYGAGAGGITVHLRADRRHIQEGDVAAIRDAGLGKLNLEMAPTAEMTRIAIELGPDQVTLVPERPEEITTEGGLDLLTVGESVIEAADALLEAGIQVSAFVDPELSQIDWLADRAENRMAGFEINTDRYASTDDSESRSQELAKIRTAARHGASRGLRVYAGHALTTENVSPIARIEPVEELNIGHFLVSRAVLVGIERAVREMLEAMTSS